MFMNYSPGSQSVVKTWSFETACRKIDGTPSEKSKLVRIYFMMPEMLCTFSGHISHYP